MASVPLQSGQTGNKGDRGEWVVRPEADSAEMSEFEQVAAVQRPAMPRSSTARASAYASRAPEQGITSRRASGGSGGRAVDSQANTSARRRSSSPAQPAQSSISLLTATLRIMSPSTRAPQPRGERIDAGWTPELSSTDDDAVRDTAGVRMPRRSSIGRPAQPALSSDSEDVASTVHPRAMPMARSPASSRTGMAASSPELVRRRRRARRTLSPASYPRREASSMGGRRSGVESEPEDVGAQTADDAFLALLEATREVVAFGSSSRAFAAATTASSVAPASNIGATARVGPSDRSSPNSGDLSVALDLPSSFMAGSGTSERSPSSVQSVVISKAPKKPPSSSAPGWLAWLTTSVNVRVYQLVAIAGALVSVGFFCGTRLARQRA